MDSASAAVLHVDVCVVGGGPAGATIALQLAKAGFSVCVIDKGGRASGHVGVSLPPSVFPILEQLELRGLVDDVAFLRSPGTIVRWGASRKSIYKPYRESGLTVERAKFDALLLDAARQAGAAVISPALAYRPLRQEDGTWCVAYRYGFEAGALHCSYVVDAAGKNALFRERRIATPRTFAIYGYWRAVPTKGADARVEAGENYWAWGTPLPGGVFVAAVFVDQSDITRAGRQGLYGVYRELLARSWLLRPYVQGYLISPLRVCDASATAALAENGPGFIKVGEAALSIDPLSSQGVQHAMVSALQAAAVVNTILRTPAHSELALHFYRERLREGAERDRRMSADYYREQADIFPTDFWISRKSRTYQRQSAETPRRMGRLQPEQRLRFSRDAVLCPKGVLDGMLIVPRPVLHHPNLERPVAYLAGHPIADLLGRVRDECTAREISLAWRDKFGEPTVEHILEWLWSHGVLVPSEESEAAKTFL